MQNAHSGYWKEAAHTKESHANSSHRKSTTLFLHAQFCTMLIEHYKRQDEDEDDDVAADFPEYSMDQRKLYLRRGPADISYVGSGNIDDCDVEHVCEWTQRRA